MNRLLLAFLPLLVAGCPTTTALFVGAPALMYKSEFDEKRTETKRHVETGLISKEAGEVNCRQMLNNVDRNHAAPAPVNPEVCVFGSFADQRYELTKAVESGALTPDLWVTKCRALPDKPAGGGICTYDPFAERLVQWRRLVAEGKTTKEGAEMDCRTYVKQARQHPVLGPELREEACVL